MLAVSIPFFKTAVTLVTLVALLPVRLRGFREAFLAQDAARAKVQGVWCMVKGLNLWDLRGLSVDNYNVWYIYIYTHTIIYIYITLEYITLYI